jgi:hypothetical protein
MRTPSEDAKLILCPTKTGTPAASARTKLALRKVHFSTHFAANGRIDSGRSRREEKDRGKLHSNEIHSSFETIFLGSEGAVIS